MSNIHGDSASHEGELTIVLDSIASKTIYIGTRAQLEAEGVIPATEEWPDGFRAVEWTANGLYHWLQRERPAGAKGPRRMFLDCDNWCLRRYVISHDYSDSEIRAKAKELRRMLWAQTPEGRRQRLQFYAALEDAGFQAFRDRVPALVELDKPKTRRRRTVQASGEENHG